MNLQERISRALIEAVDAGHVAGAVAAVSTAEGQVTQAAAGARGLDNPAPMTPDTVFWIASLTKALTTAAALQLVERGLVDLDAPVGDRLPTLAAPRVLTGFDADGRPQTRPAKGVITLRRLLAHTSGLGYDFCSEPLARYLQATGGSLFAAEAPDIPLVFDPGEGWQYGIGVDWAARLVEAVTGQGFDDYLAANVLGPLGMADTTFFPGEAVAGRRASVHARLPDGSLAPAPFAMPSTRHFGMGGGGLYSTAADYLTFLRAILGGGAADGRRILEPQTVSLMSTSLVNGPSVGALASAQAQMSHDFDAFPGMEKGWSLGFLTNPWPGPAGRSAGSLGWAGLANCYYWADPAAGVAGVFMSQVLPFADPRILAVFAEVEQAVYAA